MQLNIPEVTLLEEVGRGPDSVVYRALHRGRSCSVKVPSDRPEPDVAGVLTRFEQDVLALARLRRFGLPRVLQLGATEETAYAILAESAGEPLSQTLARELTRAQLLSVAHKLVASVKQLHAAGFVHGNLAPHNILVSGADLDVALEDRGSISRPIPFDPRTELRALGFALRMCLARVPDATDSLSRLWVRVDELASGASQDCGEVLAELELLLHGPRARNSDFPPPSEPLAGVPVPSASSRAELSQLLRASKRAAAHGGRLIEVLGPPGSGKSRLLTTFAREIGGDTQLLSVRCRDSDWAPFSALKRLLEAHLQGFAQLEPSRRATLEAALREAAGAMAAPIGLLSPRLSELFRGAAAVMTEGDVQRVFIEGLAEFLIKYLDSSGPSVLVIDDVHWLDASSRMVLARVAARLCVSGHTVVCGARDDTESREQLRRFHVPLPAERVETLILGPLSSEDAAQVVNEYLGLANGATPPPGLVTELTRLSDGTPLSLIELLRLVLERGYLRPHQDSWLLDSASVQRMRLPSSSRALIERRISQLPAATLEVLRAAAIGRGRIAERLLMRATGSSAEQVWSALAAAVEARLLTRAKDGSYEFVHDSVWEGLLRGMPDVERRTLHQRAAEALQQEGGDGPVYEYELARHYVGGLLRKDPAAAFEATRRAGLRAYELCDHALAMSFFRTAKAAARLGGIDPGREFYVRIAETSLRLGATRQSLAYFGRALDRSAPGAQRAHVLGRIAWIHHFESNAPACMRTLEAALAELRKHFPGNERVKAVRAGLITLLGQVPRRSRHSTLDAETLCSLYILCARVALDEGQPRRATAAMLQLAPLSRQLPPSRTAVHAELLLAFSLSVMNSGKLWRKSLARAQRIAREIADPVAQTLCHQFQHSIAGWRGEFAEAERQALACVVERGHYMELSELCSVCFSMYLLENGRGRPEHALQWLERAIERVCMLGQAAAAFEVIEEAAYVTLRSLGREKQASALRNRLAGVRRARLSKTGVFHLMSYQTRVQALFDRGELGAELEALIAEFERLEQSPTRVHLMVLGYYVQVAHARVQQCLRADRVRWPVLLPKLERALTDLEAAERVPLIAAHARVVRAALLFFRNKLVEAHQSLFEAERLAQEERCVWVSFAVARLRAHMLRAQGNEAAARDQARIAALWAEQYGQHSRLLRIREEFPIGPQTRVRTPADGEAQPGRSLDALLHISQANSRELGPESQARMIVDEVIAALNAERAFLFMREGPGTGLLLRAARRAGGDDLEPNAPYERTLVQQVYATGQTEIGVAVLSYGTAQNIERACLVCALVLREQAVGVVYLDRSTAVGDFTSEDALLLQELANQVPIALELANALRERERLQSNLRRAQKMEAIGRVAGGIAHDFNNILTAIQLAAGSLALSCTASQTSDIDDIVNSARRGAELTRQLLNFSRGDEILPQRVVLGEVVAKLQPMLRRLIRPNVELHLEIDPEPLHVLADPIQIERALTNLCRNADDAMTAGGTIRIAVGPSLHEPGVAIAAELRSDTAYGQLVVSDTGAGMSEDVRARLFEPFFTTKSDRGGTGLGLANVYSIVQHCGGHIEVVSEPGAGSLFRIYIPLVKDTLSAQIPPPPPAAGSQDQLLRPQARGASSVLVVDDDDVVRRLMVRALKRAGYNVLGAEDAFVAQRLFDEHRASLALVVTDMQMPGMDGSQLAAELLARDPNMKTLFVSGEQREELLRQGLLTRESLFLRKPFTPRVFVESVRSLIGSSSPN